MQESRNGVRMEGGTKAGYGVAAEAGVGTAVVVRLCVNRHGPSRVATQVRPQLVQFQPPAGTFGLRNSGC